MLYVGERNEQNRCIVEEGFKEDRYVGKENRKIRTTKTRTSRGN